MTVFATADAVREIAEKLIADTPEHGDLREVEIVYVFHPEAKRSKGRFILGQARRISGLNAFLANSAGGASDAMANSEFFDGDDD